MNRFGAILLLATFALVSAAHAQTNVRVRGTITAMDGDVLSVKSRDGKDLKLHMTDKTTVAAAKALTLADLKKGDYVGATTQKSPDGVLVINFMSDDPGLHAYVRRLAEAFGARVVCLRAIGEDNIIVLAFRDDPGVIAPASLIGRAIALQRELGLEFLEFARRLQPLHRVRVRGRPLVSMKALRAIRATACDRRGRD